jgi:hypothetical protein
VKEIRGYTSLISDCVHYDVCSVDALYAAKPAKQSHAIGAQS